MMASPMFNSTTAADGTTKLKNSTSSAAATAMMRPAAAGEQQQQQHGMKCPRCDSSNTKFCYYNNYSLSQPRHFCKTCRRYWTKGGALRNVPVGGGCRKSKKSKSSTSTPSATACGSSPSSSSLSMTSAAHNFNLGILPSAAGFIGFNYPIAGQMMGSNDYGGYGGFVSSIESLSSMNQDLHWKLQQQRLAVMFAAGGGEAQAHHHQQLQQQQQQHKTAAPQLLELEPNSFQAADVTKIHHPHDSAASSTAWFLEGTAAAANHGTNSANLAGGDWNGIAAWSDLSQFSAMP